MGTQKKNIYHHCNKNFKVHYDEVNELLHILSQYHKILNRCLGRLQYKNEFFNLTIELVQIIC